MNWPRMTMVQRAAGSGIAFDGCHHFAPSTDLASIDDALSARPLTSDTENHASDTAVQLMNTRPRARVVGSMAKTLVPRIDPRSSVAHRIVARVATSPTGIAVLRNVGPRVDPALVRFSGGRLSCVSPFPTLLMSHIGAKSGISRTTAVVYFTDTGRVILIASNLGSSQHPAWYHNVRANPEVFLFGRGFSGRFRAEEITGRARDDLFQRAKDADSPYGWYEQAATPRRIPVVAFSPLD